MSGFHLSKWYLDCVSEEGSAFIGYWARLRWGALALEYAAALFAPVGAEPRQRHLLLSPSAPARSGAQCTWRCDPLQLDGQWAAEAPPAQLDLLQTPAGGIRWSVHQPRAAARIRFREPERWGFGIDEIRGTGYVEELELTIPPWQLPFDQLLWGRCLAPGHDLVWIRWEQRTAPEASRRTFALLDGRVVEGAIVTTDGVRLQGDGAELSLGASRPLREGALAATVFSAVPGLIPLLPQRFKNAHESKRLSRGQLRLASGEPAEGWAIHEVVSW